MLTVRIRSRDGLERLQIDPSSSVAQLKEEIAKKLERPVTHFLISTRPDLVRYLLYAYYEGERSIDPGYTRTRYERLPFGAHMDVERLMAKQVRIERQDKAAVASASFDRFAAHSFQAYVQSALAFSIKRVGLLYGRVDDERNVSVEAIFEPEQAGTADRVSFERHNFQEQAAEVIASHLGLRKVGVIFNQSVAANGRDYIMNNEEICQMCQVQDEVGEHCVSAVFVQDEVEGQVQVHLEAFQCSKQAVELWRGGWFVDPTASAAPELSGSMALRHPHDATITKPVMISGLDTDTVDNDFFLVPVPVKDHVGPLGTSFPAENRLIPQGADALKAHLRKMAGKGYTEKLSDFHLLLWLASNGFDLETDIALLADAIKEGQPIREGYQVMIDTIAGL